MSGRTLTRPPVPCTSTFEPQSPVCRTSVSATYRMVHFLGPGVTGGGELQRGIASTSTGTWSRIDAIVPHNNHHLAWLINPGMEPNKTTVNKTQSQWSCPNVLCVILYCAGRRFPSHPDCKQGHFTETWPCSDRVSAGQQGAWGGGTIVLQHKTK